MKRVLLVRSDMDSHAGAGAAVTAWMIEALRDAYDVSLLTWAPVAIGALNDYCGTSLRPGDVKLHQMPAWMQRGIAPQRFLLLRQSLLMRRCRRMVDEYDVVIGIDNEMDFGRRGIQYIHYPSSHDPRINASVASSVEPFNVRWYHFPILLRSYFRVCRALAGFSPARMRTNLTLVSSGWTGRLMHEVHGVDTVTVYPPVLADFPRVPWEPRENGFVCIGRIAPEKRIEDIVEILSAVRAEGADVHLHLVGTPGPAEYVERIRRLQKTHEWVSLELDLPRAALAQVLTTHRYAIHAMRREPFGIAVATLLHAGCLLFVPDDGGLVEIVGHNRELVYHSAADAVAKIVAVVRDPARQHALARSLEAHAPTFSAQRFMEQMRAIVGTFGG
jgi:glycosyltransferase involved in cell wall biosynthesis